jgi:hypothetical protein
VDSLIWGLGLAMLPNPKRLDCQCPATQAHVRYCTRNPCPLFSEASLLLTMAIQLLILLHVWTARETYEVLGNFGWFYGDCLHFSDATTGN